MRRVFTALLLLVFAQRLEAVLFLSTGEPAYHTSTPGDNSGWQYEGSFGGFLGVPIAPFYFITAKHIGGEMGQEFVFHGDTYTTVAVVSDDLTDLAIWRVDRAFPTYAPLSSGAADARATAAIFGRGTRRGDALEIDGEAKGWLHGPGDGVERWGRNVVEGLYTYTEEWKFLYCTFDQPGLADECHLSVGDSGGGMFVLENGLWRLAGVHYAIDGPLRLTPTGADFNAALFDAGGLYAAHGDGTATLIPDTAADVPTAFYSTSIATRLGWIHSVAAGSDVFPTEDYAAWETLYFTPEQRADAGQTGPEGDFDADGIPNMLEFACNLDPTFDERVVLSSDDPAARGLPRIAMETVGSEQRLSIEYVRRTMASGSGITYTPQFSDDLHSWSDAAGTPAVTPLNARWERVKIVDTVAAGSGGRRFARVQIAQAASSGDLAKGATQRKRAVRAGK